MERLQLQLDFGTAQAVQNGTEFTRALQTIKRESQETGRATDEVATAVQQLGTESADAAKKVDGGRDALGRFTKGAKDAADAAKQVGAEGKKAGDDAAAGANKATGATDALLGATKNMVAGYLGLHTVIRLYQELTANIERTIDAQRRLADLKVGEAGDVQDLIDNLGFDVADSRAQQRTAQLVALMRERTGSTRGQVVQAVSMAQAVGFQPFDKSNPASDGKLAGFDVTAEALMYANRVRLDDETTGNLMKLASIRGVKDVQGMRGFIAEIEAGLKDTPINSPREAVKAMVSGTAARMAMGVPINQAMAQVAAAAATETDGAVAATDADIFARVAMGGSADEANRLELAKEAQRQGALTPDLIAAAGKKAAPTGADKQQQIAKLTRDIPQMREALKMQRERGGQDLAELERRAKTSTNPETRRKLMIDAERARQDLPIKLREAHEKLADAEAQLNVLTSTTRQGADDAALLLAYQTLPLAVQENVLRNAFKGKSESEQKLTAAQITSPRFANVVMAMVGKAAQQRYEAVMAGVGASGAEQTRQRNEGYRDTNTVSVFNRMQARAENMRLSGAPAGGREYLAGVEAMVDADVESLRAGGQGQIGIGAEILREFGSIGGVGPRTFTSASSEQGLRAKRMLLLLIGEYKGVIKDLPASVKQRNRAKLDQYTATLRREWSVAFNAAATDRELEQLQRLQRLAIELGAFFLQLKQQALDEKNGTGPQSRAGAPLAGGLALSGQIVSDYSNPVADLIADSQAMATDRPGLYGVPESAQTMDQLQLELANREAELRRAGFDEAQVQQRLKPMYDQIGNLQDRQQAAAAGRLPESRRPVRTPEQIWNPGKLWHPVHGPEFPPVQGPPGPPPEPPAPDVNGAAGMSEADALQAWRRLALDPSATAEQRKAAYKRWQMIKSGAVGASGFGLQVGLAGLGRGRTAAPRVQPGGYFVDEDGQRHDWAPKPDTSGTMVGHVAGGKNITVHVGQMIVGGGGGGGDLESRLERMGG